MPRGRTARSQAQPNGQPQRRSLRHPWLATGISAIIIGCWLWKQQAGLVALFLSPGKDLDQVVDARLCGSEQQAFDKLAKWLDERGGNASGVNVSWTGGVRGLMVSAPCMLEACA